MKKNVYVGSTDWEGQVCICSSEQKAWKLLREWGSYSDEEFEELKKSELLTVEKIPLDRIYY